MKCRPFSLRTLSGIIAFLLGVATLHAGESTVALTCQPDKATLSQGEPSLVACKFSNSGPRLVIINLDGFVCALDDGALKPNRAIDSAFEHQLDPFHQFALKSGEQHTVLIPLNAWLDLPPGRHQVRVEYQNAGLHFVAAPFAIQVAKSTPAALLRQFRADLKQWAAYPDEDEVAAKLSSTYPYLSEFQKDVEILLKRGLFQSPVTKKDPLTADEQILLLKVREEGSDSQ